MAVIWIITTGNSDVKLTEKTEWWDLCGKKREQLHPCEKDFSPTEEGITDLLTLPARVMGIVYGDALETHWQYLTFPLLDRFYKKLQSEKKYKPDRIIVLLTDQEAIFPKVNRADPQYDRADPDCPFWQDTCSLKPIFKHYLEQHFSKSKVEFAYLRPQTPGEGLDNWDSTLGLVRQELEQWDIEKGDRVIVSHQAGTPAISSAVQLTSLIKFGKKVQFLVSSEFDKERTTFLKGSSYFYTLQVQEARQLLLRFDYAGIRKALEKVDLDNAEQQSRVTHLLELAELWNSAKFDEFAIKMGEPAIARSQKWWWKGFEMAYLAVVRMEQKDPTEALFHSVRAIEGSICDWAIDTHSRHIQYRYFKLDRNGIPVRDSRGIKIPEFDSSRYRGDKEGSPTAKNSIDPRFTRELSRSQADLLANNKLGLYGQVLYTLFKSTFQRSADLSNHPIEIVWKDLVDERNELFHRLRGMTQMEVYEAWGTSKQEQWTKVLLDCLNLVSGESFESLKSASLMSLVHQELVETIEAMRSFKEVKS